MRKPERIDTLIPHAGAMCLLQRVIAWTPNMIKAVSATHSETSNPLRSRDRLRAVHLCEYGAQAMALHGGLVAASEGARAEPGLLVSLREVRFSVDWAHDLPGELEIVAWRLYSGPGGWQYRFLVEGEGRHLASGRAAVIVARALPA